MNEIDLNDLENPIQLNEKIDNLPGKPGIYQFFNSSGTIIYIGKAKNLKNRVRSYFQSGRPVDAKTKALQSKISDIEVILVDTEAEALILEDTLIKKHKPRYNVLLRDDKTYPFVKITNDLFPKIFPTRNVIKDGSKYIGPFTEVRNLKSLLKLIRTIFMVRSCDLNISLDSIKNKKHKICLDYHIGKCEGPCEGLVNVEHYQNNIRQAISILMGKTKEAEKYIESEMEFLSENLRFEEAALMRNRLLLLRDYNEKQKIVTPDLVDRDIFGLFKIDDNAVTLILKIRDGKLVGKRHYIIKNTALQSNEEILQRTIEKWYLESEFIPKEIHLPNEIEDMEYITDWLSKTAKKSIEIHIPKLGDKRKLVEMANSNSEFILKEYLLAVDKREQTIPRSVLSLQRDLRMKKAPRVIECFDNSHLQGTELVSSMVYFEDGKPKKSEYRKFKVKTVHGNDDFAAMRETVERRYSRLIDEKKQLPDLIIIDGGKGQLSSAVEILEKLDILDKVTIIGLAKRLEEVFYPYQSDSVILPRTSSSLRLLQQVRDEAHRFAITFHRHLRDKRTLQTELNEIPGIGEKIAQKLLTEIGSVEQIKNSSDDRLLKIISQKNLNSIREFFNQQ